MKKFLLLTGCSIVIFNFLFSQNKVKFTGSADVYFKANINNPANESIETAFTNSNGFSLGMANLILEKEQKKTKLFIDLGIGPRAKEAVFNSTGINSIVNQMFIEWQLSKMTKITFGNFNTFIGYELISPVENLNYSTSYLFSNGPFSHSGAKVDLKLDANFNLMLGVFNPTDYTDYNPFDFYLIGSQFSYSKDAYDFFFNVLYDAKNASTQFDFTSNLAFNSFFEMGINASVARKSFSGIALYLKNKISDTFNLATSV